MANLVELRKRNLSGLSPDHTAGIGYYSALLESIAGGAVPDTLFYRRFIALLEQKESAAVDPDICSISRQLGRTPLFDRYAFDLLDARPDIFSRIAECMHQSPACVDDRSCSAWCRFMLEQGYRQDHEPVVRSVLEKISPVEEINILQLSLSALYSGKGSPETVRSARNCMERITADNETGTALAMEAARILKDNILHLPGRSAEKLVRFIRRVEDKTNLAIREPFESYCSFGEQLPFLRSEGLLIVQFLYYGDPDRSGSGASGGLATIVRDLGTSLSTLSGIAGVITVTVHDTAETEEPYIPVRFIDERHAVLRMPLYLGTQSSGRFIQLRAAIRREVERITLGLIACGAHIRPVYHVRYLDSAALVSGLAAKDAGIPLVMTLTPDPHRGIDRREEQSHGIEPEDLLNDFERIVTGDSLVELADGIVGIGSRSITTSLMPYFPQLADMKEKEITGIDEGIRIDRSYPSFDIMQLLRSPDYPLHIEEPNMNRPLIVNIGRLHPAKGQTSLLRAWKEYDLWQRYNLLIIGGDFKHPNEHERGTIDFFRNYIQNNSDLKGKVAFHPALPNSAVRSIHTLLARREMTPLPDLYVCSSLKEEFGLSIIEAMSAGMIVLAPLSGGAVEYINHGVNGFLIDTGSPDSLGREIGTCIGRNLVSPGRIRALQLNAKKTIERKYSLEKIAGDFLDLYSRVSEKACKRKVEWK